jgi:hypothetical protein
MREQLVGQASEKLQLLYPQLGLSTWLQLWQQKKKWLRHLLCDFGEDSKDATIIYCDNQITLTLTQNSKFQSKSKHIELQFHFI